MRIFGRIWVCSEEEDAEDKRLVALTRTKNIRKRRGWL